MNDKKFDINSLRVASPCTVGWETMTGDERSRRCEQCSINVFNISALTHAEVKDLVLKREGRLCIRMYRRADGTVLTRDCPVGLRAVRKRVAVFAGAALTAILGLFSVSFGQKHDERAIDAAKVNIGRTVGQKETGQISGVLTDPGGAVIGGVEILLYQKGKKKPIRAISREDGFYQFAALPEGVYTLQTRSQGFWMRTITGIAVGKAEALAIDLNLEIAQTNVVVGIFLEDPLIDTSSTSVTHVITRRMLDNLPH